jgi:hypothetical protein
MVHDTVFKLIWMMVWAVTLYATGNSILCNSTVLYRMITNTTGRIGQGVLKLGNLYDWVTCLGWAIIIVLWGR